MILLKDPPSPPRWAGSAVRLWTRILVGRKRCVGGGACCLLVMELTVIRLQILVADIVLKLTTHPNWWSAKDDSMLNMHTCTCMYVSLWMYECMYVHECIRMYVSALIVCISICVAKPLGHLTVTVRTMDYYCGPIYSYIWGLALLIVCMYICSYWYMHTYMYVHVCMYWIALVTYIPSHCPVLLYFVIYSITASYCIAALKIVCNN